MAGGRAKSGKTGKPRESVGWKLSLAGAPADCVVMTKLYNLSEVRRSYTLKQKQAPVPFYTERLNGKE